jgi:hypothetical protein
MNNGAEKQLNLFTQMSFEPQIEPQSVGRVKKGGKNLLECQNCGTKFLAVRKNTKYCSNTCRSQHWMEKNHMKVITLSVPENIDDAFIDHIKQLIADYGKNKQPILVEKPVLSELKPQEISLENEADLQHELFSRGFKEFRVPKHNLGVYYDEKFSITKLEGGFLVKYY